MIYEVTAKAGGRLPHGAVVLDADADVLRRLKAISEPTEDGGLRIVHSDGGWVKLGRTIEVDLSTARLLGPAFTALPGQDAADDAGPGGGEPGGGEPGDGESGGGEPGAGEHGGAAPGLGLDP